MTRVKFLEDAKDFIVIAWVNAYSVVFNGKKP